MKELALNGSGRIVEFQIELHTRTANAFSIFILTLIGVAIASRKVRGGTGVHLFLAVIIGFTFIFLSKITAVAALKIGLPVVLAVWFPNMVFGIFGFLLYRKAQK
jgi:lipopolysaccharide export system permease protein